MGSPHKCPRWRMRYPTRSGATRSWGVGPLQAGYDTEMETPLLAIPGVFGSGQSTGADVRLGGAIRVGGPGTILASLRLVAARQPLACLLLSVDTLLLGLAVDVLSVLRSEEVSVG